MNRWTLVIAMLVALPAVAAAQTEGRTGQTPSAQPAADTGGPMVTQDAPNSWLASGFVGSNFGNNASPSSMAFGGSVGYEWRSRYGAEFDAAFSPNFQLQNGFLGLGVKPDVNSYMANAIAGVPLGPDARWQPFVMGGIGEISLRSGLGIDAAGNEVGNASRFGGDIGGGLMGFAGHWGFRADLQYFRARGSYSSSASPSTNPTAPNGPIYIRQSTVASPNNVLPANTTVSSLAVSGLHYWRANVGMAFRW